MVPTPARRRIATRTLPAPLAASWQPPPSVRPLWDWFDGSVGEIGRRAERAGEEARADMEACGEGDEAGRQAHATHMQHCRSLASTAREQAASHLERLRKLLEEWHHSLMAIIRNLL